jgi:RHS repeat-associated protein
MANVQETFTGSAFVEKGFDLWDFPARELNWNQARWITPDPAGINAADPTNPQSWNRYAYVLNNPLALVDPMGLFAQAPAPAPYSYISGNCTVFVTFTWDPGGGWVANSDSLCGGGTNGGSTGGGGGCVHPTKIQSTVIPVVAAASRVLNQTILTELGASAGVGIARKLGIYGALSVQIAVSPSGVAAYVITWAAPAFAATGGGTYMWLTASTKGAGALIGSQFGLSNAADTSQLEGWAFDASATVADGVGFGGDISFPRRGCTRPL